MPGRRGYVAAALLFVLGLAAAGAEELRLAEYPQAPGPPVVLGVTSAGLALAIATVTFVRRHRVAP